MRGRSAIFITVLSFIVLLIYTKGKAELPFLGLEIVPISLYPKENLTLAKNCLSFLVSMQHHSLYLVQQEWNRKVLEKQHSTGDASLGKDHSSVAEH